MGITRIESPKDLPKAMLFLADSGRYIRVHREITEQTPEHYILTLQAFEVDQDDNIKDTSTGNVSRTPKTPHTIMRAEFMAKRQTLQPGWCKVIPPIGVVYSTEELPEGALAVEELPASGIDGQMVWIAAAEQMWRYDAIGLLERICADKAQESEYGWLSLEVEDLEL